MDINSLVILFDLEVNFIYINLNFSGCGLELSCAYFAPNFMINLSETVRSPGTTERRESYFYRKIRFYESHFQVSACSCCA